LKALKNNTPDSLRFQAFESSQLDKDYFLANIPVDGLQYLHFEDQKKGKVKIWISVAITPDQHAVSLPNLPFGGFWCEKGLNSTALETFIGMVTEYLRAKGVRSLTIVQAPKNYEPYSDLVNYLLLKLSWNLKNVLSHQFFTGSKKIEKYLLAEGPKIREKLKASGLKTSHHSISNFDFLKKIKAWNSEKGYNSSINEDYLVQQVSSYPERYFLLKLEKGDQVLGFVLAVLLTTNSIYYFLSGLDSSNESKGGGDFLLFELFLLAKEQKVDFIDLGSSDMGDIANHGLMFFKARFSNDISNKMSWIKEF
tara:strand:+ start:61 stop:987 length:927 start_codon:yes stop_codon:yes gene_type:complete